MRIKSTFELCFILMSVLVAMPATLPAQTRILSANIPAAVAQLKPLGSLSGSTNLQLAIGLPLRNQSALSNLLQQIYDPASPNYRHYLTPAEFAAKFGPTAADYQKVIRFATSHGLKVTATHPNRVLLDVTGPVSSIEKAFSVKMQVYQHPTENRTFYAPDSNPTLDATLPVIDISGLNNYALPHPQMQEKPLPQISAANAASNAGSGPSGTYMGKDFRAAYVPGVTLNGLGQTVGLLQFDGYTASDITYYETHAGLPNVPLQNVLLDGFGGLPTGSGGEVEVSLDIEMSISMATNLTQVIVYMAGPSGNWHDILNRMATDNLAKQLSCSWYLPGGSADPVADGIFQEMAVQGQSFYSASGDSDAYTALISFPGDSPYITQVGGTSLTTTGPQGSWVSETVWNWGGGTGSGGGISTQYAIPSWQTNAITVASKGSTNLRNTPDVAMTADNVYVRADGVDHDIGGTSCAAPLWAGFTALVNQQAAGAGQASVGFINPLVYAIGAGAKYTTAFHDIKTGNNESPSSPTKFSAVTGYDLCTGLGTPNGQALINSMVNPEPLLIAPATGFSAIGGVGGPFSVTSQIFSLTNSGTNSIHWTLTNTSVWLTASPLSGTLAVGGPATTVTVSLNTAASNLVIGAYSAALLFTNSTDGIGQSRPFTLTIISPPTITQQPTNQAALDGTTVTFNVSTTGGQPMYYQWQFKGTNLADGGKISGSATSMLTITNVSFDVAGTYDVIVSNAAAAVVSSNVLLSITPSAPVITMQPANATVVVKGTAAFSVSAVGTKPFLYQWAFNGTNISGATNNPLILTNVQLSQAGAYSVALTNVNGSIQSSNASLTVLSCLPAPANLVSWWPAEENANDIIGGNNGTLVGAVTYGLGEVGQAFAFNGTNGYVQIGGSYALTGARTVEGWVYAATNTGDGLPIFAGGPSGASDVFGIAGTTGNCAVGQYNLYVDHYGTDCYDGGVAVTPNQWNHVAMVYNGSQVQFFVNGVAGPLVSGPFYNYNLNTSGIGGNSYYYGGTSKVCFNGLIDELSVYNRALTTNEIVSIYNAGSGGKCFNPVLPFIITQPTNQTVALAGTANFSVTAGGSPNLSYQWTFNQTNVLAGATNTTLTLTNLQLAQAGNYSVIVSNPYSSTNSSNAVLTVYGIPPAITAQPASRTAGVGETTMFTVSATGSLPLSFQWSFGTTNLLGATNATLILTNVQFTQTGNYSVFVTNMFGSTNSSNAVLTVVTTPPCTPPPANLVSWWPAEGDANDAAGTNNGTLVGAVTYGLGEVGQAFAFNGTNGYVQIGGSYALTGARTVEGWVYAATNTGDGLPIFAGGPSGASDVFGIAGTTGNCAVGQYNLYVDHYGTDCYDGGVAVTPNQWNHVAMVYNGSQVQFFVNGVAGPLVSGPFYNYNLNTSGIGGNSYYYGGTSKVCFNGLIDELSVYNRALTTNEIAAIYEAGNGGKCLVNEVPPSIISQPLNKTVGLGGTPSFSVTAVGSPTLRYQWSVNTTNLSGATNATLTLTNVQYAQAGNYSVLVTNLFGSINSSNALLTVLSTQPCTPHPTNVVSWWPAEGNANDVIGGNNGILEGNVTYGPGEVGLAFNFNGTNGYVQVGGSYNISGARTIEGWVYPGTNSGLGMPIIVGGPNAQTDYLGIAGGGGGCSAGQYQLYIDHYGTDCYIGGVSVTPNHWNHVAVVYTGSQIQFFVNGVPGPVINGSLYNYNINTCTIGGNLLGGTTTQPLFTGLIDELTIYNRALATNEIVAIYNAGAGGKCLVNLLPPTIVTQPGDQEVAVNGTATFSVIATGNSPLSYQWSFGTTNLPGATNATLTLTNVQFVQAGIYSVLVTNLYGSTNSFNASLTVTLTPPCVSPPVNLVSWWPAEGNANDVIGGNNGILEGNVTYGPGEVGLAFNFNGTNGYVQVGGSYNISGARTIEGWVYPGTNSGLGMPIIVGGPNAQTDYLGIAGGGGGCSAGQYQLYIDHYGTDCYIGGVSVTPNHWNHVAVVYTGSQIQFFVNGVPGPVINGSLYNYNINTCTIGGNLLGGTTTKPLFTGLIDELSLYSRALTTNEIVSIYNAGAEGKCLGNPVLPVITTQPTNQTVTVAATASFTVTANGSPALSYQWSLNTTNLPGATNATLALTNVQLAQAGVYAVFVASPYGSVDSSNAILIVNDKIDHFTWNQILSPRFVNVPFVVALQAQDATNQIFTNFTGTVTLSSTNGLPVNPPVTANFVQGLWTGSVTISQPATNLVLRAADGGGDYGLANAINVVIPPALGTDLEGSSLLIYWPVASPTFVLETTSSLSPANWVPVSQQPAQIGGQNLISVSLTQTNCYYRLRYSGP